MNAAKHDYFQNGEKMTCKDCIHYRVCYYHDFEDCEHFKCKSEFVNIPCNIGSTVYFVDVEFNADTKNFEPALNSTSTKYTVLPILMLIQRILNRRFIKQ